MWSDSFCVHFLMIYRYGKPGGGGGSNFGWAPPVSKNATTSLKRKVALNKWMTKEILEKKRKMEISRRKFLKRANELNETNYRKIKKEYSNDIKRAKNSYYGKQLSRTQKDGKKVWSIINELLPKNQHQN